MRPAGHPTRTAFFPARRKLLSVAIGHAILGLSTAHAAAISVNDPSDVSNPVTCTLRDAIVSANTDQAVGGCTAGSGVDTINFDELILPNTILLAGGELRISTPMTVQGPGAEQLTIDGNGLSRVLNIDDGGFGPSDVLIDVNLSGLTVTGGAIAPMSVAFNGAGIRSRENLTLSNVTVSGNSEGNSGGGGLYQRDGTVTITGSTVSGNTGRYGGGGILSSNTSLYLIDSNVSNNLLTSGSGAGISATGGYLSLVRASITGNTAQGTFRDGGGLSCGIFPTEISIIDSQITSNIAPVGGAMSIRLRCNMSISNSTLASNIATGAGSTDRGGAISANSNGQTGDDRFTLSLVNSTISGNSANRVGAVYAGGGVLYLNHVTITGNSAVEGTFPVPPYGLVGPVGGLQVDENFHVSNTIIANNTGADCNDIFNLLVTNLNNLIEDGSCSTGAVNLITGDPALGPLQDNGGPTPTHALLTGSVAIDAGDNVSCALTDQRGVPRSDGACDIGAYEVSAIVVNTLNDVVADDGFCSLREAVSSANFDSASGSMISECRAGGLDDTIVFDPSILPGTITLGGTELGVYSAVTIQGPGAGQLTISANGGSRIFRITDGDASVMQTVSLSGLTLTGGISFQGGAIRNYENLALDACVLTGNSGYSGGGLHNQGTATITNTTLSGNSVSGSGGGLYSNFGVAFLIDSRLYGNTASSGGGAMNASGPLDVTGSSVYQNMGGGLRNAAGTLTVTDSSVFGNTISIGGGGLTNDQGGNLIVTSSTISGNVAATEFGGGIDMSDGTLWLTNSTLSGNSALRGGGGVAIRQATAHLLNSTLFGNSAAYGGGLQKYFTFATVNLTNTVIASSVASSECEVAGQIDSNINTLIEDGSCAEGAVNLITGDPLLGPLQDNGGPTQTHAILAGSPLIDAGDATECAGLTTDQTGGPRSVDSDANGSSICDIGSFEYMDPILVFFNGFE